MCRVLARSLAAAVLVLVALPFQVGAAHGADGGVDAGFGGLHLSDVAAKQPGTGHEIGVTVTLENSTARTVPARRVRMFLVSADGSFGLGEDTTPAMGPHTSAVLFLPAALGAQVRPGTYAVRACLRWRGSGLCATSARGEVTVSR